MSPFRITKILFAATILLGVRMVASAETPTSFDPAIAHEQPLSLSDTGDDRTTADRSGTRSRDIAWDDDDDQDTGGGQPADRTMTETTTVTETRVVSDNDYRGVNRFFNIREANPDVMACEWEFEANMEWSTYSNQKDDEFGLTQSIKYGFTDDFFAELEVLEDDLGDGGNQGNGDLKLTAFYRIVRESDCMPAIATYATLRIPSGDGSSRVDGTLHGIVTKKLFNDCFRAHLDGFIETANGDAGEDDQNRRHFQWGVGPGFDYQIDKCTTAVLNYLHRSSDQYGNHNLNILELGVTREIYRCGDVHSDIKVAADVGLDGAGETENFGAKVQWALAWK